MSPDDKEPRQSDTPRTDALYEKMPSTFDTSADAFWCREMGDLARQLERELAEAIELLRMWEYFAHEDNWSPAPATPSVTPAEWQKLVNLAREEGRLAGKNEALAERLVLKHDANPDVPTKGKT